MTPARTPADIAAAEARDASPDADTSALDWAREMEGLR